MPSKRFRRRGGKILSGKVIGNRNGYGFITLNEEDGEWLLPPTEMSRVLDGDLVRARATGQYKRGKSLAVIEEILSRPRDSIIGRCILQDGKPMIVPDSERIPRWVAPVKPVPNLRAGELVKISLIAGRNLELPIQLRGRIEKVLGVAGKVEIETDIALEEFHLRSEFSEQALAALARLPDEVKPGEHKDRKDLSSTPFVTIDGEDARDYDDAVFCRREKNGWQLWVAIADVSHYVRPNDPLDAEAKLRTTSIYFPDRVVPMLPEKLSNDLCSLMPARPRLVMVCQMQINKDGECIRSEMLPALITSRARLTYDLVANYLGEKTSSKKDARPASGHNISEDSERQLKDPAIGESLRSLKELTNTLLKRRKARSALEFHHLEQVRVELATDGRVENLDVYERNFAHLMIEEAMLIANQTIAGFLETQKSLWFCYRIHEQPEEEKLEELRLFLEYYRIKIPRGPITPEIYGKILEKVHTYPEAAVLEKKILRSLQQARYTTQNHGHFGLNYEKYTHFTSPIRRYPDLLVHRALKHVLADKQAKRARTEYPYSAAEVERMAGRCSEYERTTDKAVWQVQDACKCRYLKMQQRQEFDGTVVHTAEFGFFVQLNDIPIDGLVHIKNLKGDYYRYEATDHTLVGVRSGRVYRLGQKISVRVLSINLENRRIDFAPI